MIYNLDCSTTTTDLIILWRIGCFVAVVVPSLSFPLSPLRLAQQQQQQQQ